jgi:hypothetical protein
MAARARRAFASPSLRIADYRDPNRGSGRPMPHLGELRQESCVRESRSRVPKKMPRATRRAAIGAAFRVALRVQNGNLTAFELNEHKFIQRLRRRPSISPSRLFSKWVLDGQVPDPLSVLQILGEQAPGPYLERRLQDQGVPESEALAPTPRYGRQDHGRVHPH